ncbi:MAG: efflux RND transporter periplasmic adaptor subunit [Gemmatimonadota bacterium]|nr:efflux RND transporter periplasmic adaptor subunit [Gemmatimonadota bacterium]
MVDIQRAPVRNRRKYVYGGVGAVVLALLAFKVSTLQPAPPSVDRATLMIDTVRRGEMVRQVRGPGTLVPEQIRLISALTAGRVENIALRAGEKVTKDTPLLELSNPDVQLQSLEAQRQLTQAEAELVNLRTTLEQARLTQASTVSLLRTEYQEAQRTLSSAETLAQRGLASAGELQRAREKALDLQTRIDLERQRLEMVTQQNAKQLALQQNQVERMKAIAKFQENRIASMQVKAGEDGVLTDMSLELGQYVVPGQLLARVAQPGRLKAVLHIPETQAKDVMIGQHASIDTRNGIVPGHVIRQDPGATNGTVTVDVALDGPLPPGARPDLSIDGTVEIERLKDIMYVGRPAYGQSESTVGLFRLEEDGKTADRVNAKLGRSSVNTIEVLQGLKVGDKVIISDMSNWDSYQKVRLR